MSASWHKFLLMVVIGEVYRVQSLPRDQSIFVHSRRAWSAQPLHHRAGVCRSSLRLVLRVWTVEDSVYCTTSGGGNSCTTRRLADP
jgi:hypothetical protein